MKKIKYNKPVMILRKKLIGENSIEELAYHFKREMNIELLTLPCTIQKIQDIFKNIAYIKKIKSPVFHFISPEAYLLPFVHGKRIITYHDLGTINNSRKKIYRLIRSILFIYPSKYFADAITFISNESKNEYKAFIKSKKENKFHVIYNPYDERLKAIAPSNNKKFTILHIGTAERKNLVSTIKACKSLNVTLIIIGRLNERQQEALNENKIDYENYSDVNYEDIIKFYGMCDIVSFPSSYEGFGLPVIEANIMQRPIFVGDIPILHEIAGDAAIFVKPHDIEQIQETIKKLMENKELRSDLIEKGIRNAKRFNQDKIIMQYEKLYNE